MPVRGLTTAGLSEDVDQALRGARDALHAVRMALERADSLLHHALGGLAFENAMNDVGPEHLATILEPVLHAADLVRQAHRVGFTDTLKASESITDALDVLRGWVV